MVVVTAKEILGDGLPVEVRPKVVEPQQVVAGQCGTCGVHSEGPDARKSPEDMYQFWFRRVVAPTGLEGVTLVCDDCKALVMMVLQHMPDRGPAKLKGYT